MQKSPGRPPGDFLHFTVKRLKFSGKNALEEVFLGLATHS